MPPDIDSSKKEDGQLLKKQKCYTSYTGLYSEKTKTNHTFLSELGRGGRDGGQQGLAQGEGQPAPAQGVRGGFGDQLQHMGGFVTNLEKAVASQPVDSYSTVTGGSTAYSWQGRKTGARGKYHI